MTTDFQISTDLQTAIDSTANPAGELFALSDMAQDFADLAGFDLQKATKRDGMIRRIYTPTKTLQAAGVSQIEFERNADGTGTTATMRKAIIWDMSPDMIERARAERMRRELQDNQAALMRKSRRHTGRNAYKNLWPLI